MSPHRFHSVTIIADTANPATASANGIDDSDPNPNGVRIALPFDPP